MTSTKRYNVDRSLRAHSLSRCTVTSSNVMATNLMPGTAILAMKMIRAMSQAPASQNSSTPPMIVLSAPLPTILVFITGSRLAGM
ncbi:hypothetical protein D3C79_1015330 [compost metagenome]